MGPRAQIVTCRSFIRKLYTVIVFINMFLLTLCFTADPHLLCLCCCTVCDYCFDLFFSFAHVSLSDDVIIVSNYVLNSYYFKKKFSCLDFQRWFGVVDFPIGDKTVGLRKSACW